MMNSLKIKIFTGILLFLPSFLMVSGQESSKRNKITGTIRDSNGQPLPGVAIFIDEVNTNKATDIRGIYKIRVNPEAKTISVFSAQYGTSETELTGKNRIDFMLGQGQAIKQNTKDESVDESVSVGYGSVKKRDLTTPVSTINARQEKYKSYQNIYDMIRGEVPGVKVTGTKIQINGPSSFNSSEDPLFIVDGVPVDDIRDIIPGQVKSIDILKGAAAGIYGTRAANGVIIIKLISADDIK